MEKGMALTTMLDECQSQGILFTATVEGLVRRLVVLKKVVGMERMTVIST